LPNGKTANANYIVFGLIRPEIEPTIYHTRCELNVYVSLILHLLETLLVVVFFICKYMLYKQINKQTNKHILPPYLWSFSYEHSLTLLLYCPCLCSRSLCASVGYLELFKVTVCNVALFACFCLAYVEFFISVWLMENCLFLFGL